jgi:hypothetical protein
MIYQYNGEHVHTLYTQELKKEKPKVTGNGPLQNMNHRCGRQG